MGSKTRGEDEFESVTSQGENNNLSLDPLIMERKEEKRKELMEKLQKKLKTIRNRRVSGVNNEPFPEGAFERLKSNNIWHDVLGYLTEPSDVTSAYFACGTFTGILDQPRKLLMFPKVLKVFKTNADKADEDSEADGQKMGNKWYGNWEGICLSARGVSTAWKETADLELFECDHDLDEDISFLHILEPRRSKLKSVRFEDEKSVDRLISSVMEHYAHNQNQIIPTLVRRVEVLVTDRITEPFFAKLMEFFRIHGRHVLSFDFGWGRFENTAIADPAGAYERLCEMLECMPNLRRLNFRFNTEQAQGQGAGEALQNFRRRLNERPFPSLVLLEHLNCSWDTDNAMLSQILGKSGNLRSVRLPNGHSVAAEVIEPLMGPSLELFLGRPTTIISNRFPWPLKYLLLSGEAMSLNASQIFPAINHFRGTLQYLFLPKCPKIDSKNVRLDLPHLKFFFTPDIHLNMGFDGLLLLKSLEKVVVWAFEEDFNAKVKVKKFLESGEMEKSNVWQYFPNLKRLLLRRRGWDLRCEWFDRPTSPSLD